MYGYDYNYDYGYDSYDYGATTSALGFLAGFGIVMWIIGMAIAVFTIICIWKIFTKAGKKGWAAIVPIYNIIVMLEIAELPMWYIALFFVPFANIYAMFKIYIEIAHKFGKSTGFGVGLVFLGVIFMPMLAFGKTEYKGNNQGGPSNNNLVNNTQFNANVNVGEQFNTNTNFNMQNNTQFNVMDVNNSMGSPVNNFNVQNNENNFQPAGDLNNNINGGVNIETSLPQNNIASNVNNMQFNNNTIQTNSNDVNMSVNNFSQPVQPSVDMAQVNQSQVNNNMIKTCPKCGNQVDLNAMFCPNCGNNI